MPAWLVVLTFVLAGILCLLFGAVIGNAFYQVALCNREMRRLKRERLKLRDE